MPAPGRSVEVSSALSCPRRTPRDRRWRPRDHRRPALSRRDAREATSQNIRGTLQIGSALGIAIIGDVFCSALGREHTSQAYPFAFSFALGCIAAM
jgi:hypothetical protein